MFLASPRLEIFKLVILLRLQLQGIDVLFFSVMKTGFELVKQNDFQKFLRETRKKVQSRRKSFLDLWIILWKMRRVLNFCKLIWLSFANLTLCLCLRNYEQGLLEAHKSNLEINHKRTLNVVVCKNSKND